MNSINTQSTVSNEPADNMKKQSTSVEGLSSLAKKLHELMSAKTSYEDAEKRLVVFAMNSGIATGRTTEELKWDSECISRTTKSAYIADIVSDLSEAIPGTNIYCKDTSSRYENNHWKLVNAFIRLLVFMHKSGLNIDMELNEYLNHLEHL